MSEAMSIEECEEHIKQLNEKITCSDFLRHTIEGALKSLSSDLYKDSSHFLLELLQNADDNDYGDDVRPQATFMYRNDGFLFFGCNEVGFTKANVEAICSAARSTKVLRKDKKGSTGEKGIGFKSVFRVANEVWIKSGNYSFMFDKRKPLGMISPIWTPFPELPEAFKTRTMFCLKVEKGHHQDAIRDQLRALSSSVLLFLRRLKGIQMVYMDELFVVRDEITLACESIAMDNLRIATTTTVQGSSPETARYLVSEYTVKDMPFAEQRIGIDESAIVLAFPVNEDWQPKVEAQDMYAFLPICASGFPFLIQADFLLVSSRQDIDTDQPWNRRLRDRLSHALAEAFLNLNKSELRYTWPRFLPPSRNGLHPFLGFILTQLSKHLSSEAILENWAGQVQAPKNLCLVPPNFLDDAGNLLIMAPNYLCSGYAYRDISPLVTKTLTARDFIDQLLYYVAKKKEEFHTQPDAWHSRVCWIIIEEMKVRPRMSDISRIPLVPMANGTWTISYNKKLLLPEVQGNRPLPMGVEMLTIDPTAAKDVARKNLFVWLGAKVLDYEEVCIALLKQHQGGRPTFSDPLEILLNHAQYLYNVPFGQKKMTGLQRKLWVLDTESTARHGDELYMDQPGIKAPVSQYFKGNSKIAAFIHPKYLELYHNQPEFYSQWMTWLQVYLGISTTLRVFDTVKHDLSVEYRYIVENSTSRNCLLVLRDNYLKRTASKNELALHDKLAMLEVQCTNGTGAKLKDTLLPTLRMAHPLLAISKLKFVDTLQEEDRLWPKLSAFGVLTTFDLRLLLRVLQSLSQNDVSPKKGDVVKLYGDILSHCQYGSKAQDAVRNAFKEHPLVFVAESHLASSERWIKLAGCCWNAPDCLRNVKALRPHFETLEKLFHKILEVPNATSEDIATELVELDGDTSSIKQIKQLFMALSDGIKKTPSSYEFMHLTKQRIFPVQGKEGQTILTTATDARWFIPDRSSYKKTFGKVLHLFDFTLRELESLEPLLQKLGIVARKISRNVMEETVVKGRDSAILNAQYTEAYRTKAPYLLSLVGEFEEDRLSRLLSGIEVYGAHSIAIRRSIRITTQQIRGEDERGSVVVENGLKIFVSKQDLANNSIAIWSLVEQLCSVCKILPKHKEIVTNIMSQGNCNHIEAMLESHDIVFEKRIRPTFAAKLIDDSAGVILPSASVIAGPSAHVKLTQPAAVVPQGTTLVRKETETTPDAGPKKAKGRPNEGLSFESEAETVQQQLQRAVYESSRLQLSAKPSHRTEPRTGLSQNEKDFNHIQTTSAQHSKPSKQGSSVPTRRKDAPEPKYSNHPRIALAVHDDNINEITDDENSSASSSSRMLSPDPIFSSRGTRARSITPDTSIGSISDDAEACRIGEQGERQVYEYLKRVLGPTFDESMWTSKTRGVYTGIPFDEDEKLYSDFTVSDEDEAFTNWLVEKGYQKAGAWVNKGGEPILYHIEVKSTYGPHHEAFRISQNQFEMARQWQVDSTGKPSDVYVILRVSSMIGNEGSAHVHPFVDPYKLHMEGALSLVPESYHVFSD